MSSLLQATGHSRQGIVPCQCKPAQLSAGHMQVATTFPSEWIRRKKRDGFYVTVMGCIGSGSSYHWVVVVTSGTGFTGQAVELDFVYPSEAIHHYWDEGAPCCPATALPNPAGQCTMSTPHRPCRSG